MPTVDVISGYEGVQKYIDEIAADFRNLELQPFARLELFELADQHAKYFADASDPTGKPWPDIEESTKKRKGHGRILIDKQRLITSLTQKLAAGSGDAIRDIAELQDETDIIFGTLVDYSGQLEKPSALGKVWLHVGINDQYLDGVCERLINYAVNELAAVT
jgi:hypothetical protein